MVPTADPILSEAAAAAQLGIAPRTLRGKRLAGEIGYVQITDRRIGYRQSQINAYADRRTITPAALAEVTRAAQGLPAAIEDPAVLARLAAIFHGEAA